MENKELETIAHMHPGKFFRRSNYLDKAKKLFRKAYL
jgi:hypothetical protein